MDAVEELRKAIVAGDLERAGTLIGPVYYEREGLRRLAGEGRYGRHLSEVVARQRSLPPDEQRWASIVTRAERAEAELQRAQTVIGVLVSVLPLDCVPRYKARLAAIDAEARPDPSPETSDKPGAKPSSPGSVVLPGVVEAGE